MSNNYSCRVVITHLKVIAMNHRIQIIVDDKLDSSIKAGARKMGLSVSAYARLALMNGLSHKNLLLEAMGDVKSNNVEALTLDAFRDQIDGI